MRIKKGEILKLINEEIYKPNYIDKNSILPELKTLIQKELRKERYNSNLIDDEKFFIQDKGDNIFDFGWKTNETMSRMLGRVELKQKYDNKISADDVSSLVHNIHTTELDSDQDLDDRIYSNKYYSLTEIPINEIMSPYEVDYDKVHEYIEEYKNNSNYPPIVVDKNTTYGPRKYEIIDGTHRLDALKRLGLKTIKAYIPIN